eukprot:95909_1
MYIGVVISEYEYDNQPGNEYNTIDYVDFVPIFKISQVEITECIKKRKQRKRTRNKKKRHEILSNYYRYNAERDNISCIWRCLSDLDKARLTDWNKNSGVLKYQKVKDEHRYNQRRWNPK